ncbi:MAG: DHA2 family efflux MFS transporter permease subunit [Acidimicrobiia bacterium]
MPLPLRQRLRPEYAVAFVYCAALFMDIMDTTIVNVALRTMAEDFGRSTSSIEWVVIGYLLSLAVWIPASGWIGDRFGTKRTILFAIAIFTISSALCGMSGSLNQLIAARILQGVGGGMLAPVGTAMLYRAFPPERRAKASTVLMIPVVVAPASGPVLGGLIIEHASWHWIFLVNIPIGVITFVFGLVMLTEYRERTVTAFDLPGFVLSAGALACVLYAVSQGPAAGWGSPEIVISGAIGIALSVSLVWWELRAPEPMLQFRLFSSRMFARSNLAGVFVYGSFIGVLFLTALFLQQARGLGPLDTGLTIFPEALGVISAAQIVGRIYSRVGPRRLMGFGLIGTAGIMTLFTQIDAGTNLWLIRGLLYATGFSIAFSFVSLQVATFATISPADTGRASAIFSTVRQASAAAAVALLATVLTSLLPSSAGPDSVGLVASPEVFRAFHRTYLVAAGLAFIGSAVAWSFRDSDVAHTLKRA